MGRVQSAATVTASLLAEFTGDDCLVVRGVSSLGGVLVDCLLVVALFVLTVAAGLGVNGS